MSYSFSLILSPPSCPSRRKTARTVRFRGLWRTGIALIGILLVSTLPVFAQDARTLLKKTVDAYQALSAYEGQSTVTTVLTTTDNKTLRSGSFTSELIVKRPNKLKLTLTTNTGTLILYSDGVKLTVYEQSPNQYSVGPSAPTLTGLLPLLLNRARIAAVFDPLDFLGRRELPSTLADMQNKGDTVYEGHPVHLVTGVTRTPARTLKSKDGRTLQLPASVRNWTWWIDKETSLLRKIEVRAPNVSMALPVREGNKVVRKPIQATALTRHIVSQFKANGAIPDSVFTFTPPPGATERKSMEQLLRGGK